MIRIYRDSWTHWAVARLEAGEVKVHRFESLILAARFASTFGPWVLR